MPEQALFSLHEQEKYHSLIHFSALIELAGILLRIIRKYSGFFLIILLKKSLSFVVNLYLLPKPRDK